LLSSAAKPYEPEPYKMPEPLSPLPTARDGGGSKGAKKGGAAEKGDKNLGKEKEKEKEKEKPPEPAPVEVAVYIVIFIFCLVILPVD
jgi:hypothetical protein